MGSYISFCVTSAEPARLISRIAESGIWLDNIVSEGDLTLMATVRTKEYRRLKKFVEKENASIEIVEEKNPWSSLLSMGKRPILLTALLLLMVAALLIPRCIFFVEIEGNVLIPDRQITECAAKCGIRFGASRKAVRSEITKNQLLSAIPQLQWAGVNTRGCVAVISVQEKPQEISEETIPYRVSSIVAARDGVVSSCTATDGTLLCQIGQAVKKGQTLISAYTDCGFAIRATNAKGEVMAQTQRTLQVITPQASAKKGELTGRKTRTGIRIGKKLIFFCKDSGISIPICVKMYEENFLILPGGFTLPVALVRETCLSYAECSVTVTGEDFSWVADFTRSYLKERMGAGQILTENIRGQVVEDAYHLTGQFACVESIGLRRSEEIIQGDGENS